MLFSSGETVGPYVVIAPAGSGGMGEVYKARDTRLNRIVALKVMGGEGANRNELAQRFVSEARAIAALNHTHICAVYDTGRHAGKDYLVLEYLEGETLAHRLQRGALSPKELLQYATEIAEALDFAHRRGIIHRDLKPSNVFLCRRAGVKLLDFGLARMHAAASGTDSVDDLATQPLEITSEGTIVGTLHYLAPERLDGRPADARSDIFAYGAILYEMVMRRKAYPEQTQARVIAAILSDDPPQLEPNADIPAAFKWIVQVCLAKDPEDRWQSLGDVARVLKNISAPAMISARAPSSRYRSWATRVGLVILAALASGAAWFVGASRERTTDPLRPTIFPILPPVGEAFAMSVSTVKTIQFALSPDGRTVAFVAGAHGSPQLWVRELGHAEPRSLPDTAGASYPFWSPDSRFVGFFANGALRKVGLNGRPSQPLCDAPNGRGGAWQDETIVFSPDNSGGLFRVSASGGRPTPFTTAAENTSHRWPQFLPSGRVLFFVRSSNPEVEGIYDTSLERPHEMRQLRPNGSGAVHASGMLLYVLNGALVAQALDERSGTLTGEAIPLGQKTSVSSAANPAVSASSEGTLATWGNVGGLSELVWFNQNGDRVGTAGTPDRYVDFRLSPDDRRLAVARIDAATNTADLDVLDLDRGDFTSLSSTPQTDATPIWSPDGQRLVFRSNRRRNHDLFERPSNGSGTDRLLYTSEFGNYPTDWSRHDGTILFHHLGKSTKHDILRFNPKNRQAEPVQHTAAAEVQGQQSPGGRLAYASDETGMFNVYVRTLAESSGPTKVSVDGGFDPHWSADGRTLFFVNFTGLLMSADITNTDPPQVMNLKPLFNSHIQPPAAPYLSSYAVTRDGTRFLINVPTDQPGSVPITVTTHWPSLIQNAR